MGKEIQTLSIDGEDLILVLEPQWCDLTRHTRAEVIRLLLQLLLSVRAVALAPTRLGILNDDDFATIAGGGGNIVQNGGALESAEFWRLTLPRRWPCPAVRFGYHCRPPGPTEGTREMARELP